MEDGPNETIYSCPNCSIKVRPAEEGSGWSIETTGGMMIDVPGRGQPLWRFFAVHDPPEVLEYLGLRQQPDLRTLLGPLSLVLGLEVLRRVVAGRLARHRFTTSASRRDAS